MQDIRVFAAQVADKANECCNRSDGYEEEIARIAHTAIRSYAVDLLMNLGMAIQPTSNAERTMVAWLRQELTRVAAQIPEP